MDTYLPVDLRIEQLTHSGDRDCNAVKNPVLMLQDLKPEVREERLGGAAYIRREVTEIQPGRCLVNVNHELPPDAAAPMTTGYEEVVDVTAGLNVGIAHDLVVELRDKRIDGAHAFLPFALIQICRRPCFDLLRRVVG